MSNGLGGMSPRRAELARIHILKDEMNLDRETYEAVLWAVARVNSAADLDEHGRRQVIEHMQAKLDAYRKAGSPVNPAKEKEKLLSKIGAQAYALGKNWRYVGGMAWKMFRVREVQWCTPDQLHRIASALAYAQQRQAKKKAAAKNAT